MLAALLLLVLAAPAAADRPKGIIGSSDPCVIVRIVDGDTADVAIRGKTERLRLLAIDTEESWPSPSKPVTPFGLETSKWAKGFLVAEEPCWVEYGPERYDAYDRLLAYLWRKDTGEWKMYNLQAVERGYSPYFTKYGYSENHHASFVAAEKRAQKAKKGIWDPGNSADLRGKYLGPDGLRTWWDDRADSLKAFEKVREEHPEIVDTRTRYPVLMRRHGETVTVFTSIRQADESGSQWVGKCEGKLHESFEVLGEDAVTEDALRGTVGKYRYFTGRIDVDGKTVRLFVSTPDDVRLAPKPKPQKKASIE